MVEAQKQTLEVFRVPGKHKVDPLGQEAFGVGVQTERVEEDITR